MWKKWSTPAKVWDFGGDALQSSAQKHRRKFFQKDAQEAALEEPGLKGSDEEEVWWKSDTGVKKLKGGKA